MNENTTEVKVPALVRTRKPKVIPVSEIEFTSYILKSFRQIDNQESVYDNLISAWPMIPVVLDTGKTITNGCLENRKWFNNIYNDLAKASTNPIDIEMKDWINSQYYRIAKDVMDEKLRKPSMDIELTISLNDLYDMLEKHNWSSTTPDQASIDFYNQIMKAANTSSAHQELVNQYHAYVSGEVVDGVETPSKPQRPEK